MVVQLLKYRAWFKQYGKEFSLDFTSKDKWTKHVHPSRTIRVELMDDGKVIETWNVNEDPNFSY